MKKVSADKKAIARRELIDLQALKIDHFSQLNTRL